MYFYFLISHNQIIIFQNDEDSKSSWSSKILTRVLKQIQILTKRNKKKFKTY